MVVEEAKLFVGGLSQETTKESLREHFSKHGILTDAVVMYDLQSGRSRGFGFVTFANADSLVAVLASPQIIDSKEVDCKRACPREVMSQRQPPQQGAMGSSTAKTNKIFVGGLPDLTPEEFRSYFAKYGQVVDAVLMTDKNTNKPRGFGFVTYENPESVEEAVRSYRDHQIKEKWVEVKKAQSKEQMQSTRPSSQAAQRAPAYSGYPGGGYSSSSYDYYGYRSGYGSSNGGTTGYESRKNAYQLGYDPYGQPPYNETPYSQERRPYSYGTVRGSGYPQRSNMADPYGASPAGPYEQTSQIGYSTSVPVYQSTGYRGSGGPTTTTRTAGYNPYAETNPTSSAPPNYTGPISAPDNPYSSAVYGYAPQRASGRGSAFTSNRAYPY